MRQPCRSQLRRFKFRSSGSINIAAMKAHSTKTFKSCSISRRNSTSVARSLKRPKQRGHCFERLWRNASPIDSHVVDWTAVHDFLVAIQNRTQEDEALQYFTSTLLNSWSTLHHLASTAFHETTKVSNSTPSTYVDTFDYDEFLNSLSGYLEPTPPPSVHQQWTMSAFLDASQTSMAGFLSTVAQTRADWRQIGFLLSILGALVVLGSTKSSGQVLQQESAVDEMELQRLTTNYDPEGLEEYWSRRWTEVSRREAEIGAKIGQFLSKILLDIQLGQLNATMSLRAKELRLVVEDLGPAFIKVFQALATRGDVFPEECTKEFTLLQDQVEVFPTELALAEIEASLGVPWRSVFQWISQEPLAAASLGQVYHGLLVEEYGAKEVAVKVQRPRVFRSACLDVFILRRLVNVMTLIPNMSQEWKHLLDGWAIGFFQELDYVKEAHHMMLFKKNLKELKDVKIPGVFVEFSSRTLLTTEWIFGEKFTEARFLDPRSSCRTLLNCYLTQLLNVGYLHADPHPGNLICTNEGKLCLLDFGLVAEVTEEQRYALIEFITHLWMEDWDAIAVDLEHLQFLPENSTKEANSELKGVLQKIFGDMVHGDGLRVNKITRELDQAAREHQIVIPSYFTLILRAFCIVEGLCIESTGGFSIVQECAPYIARRLLQDDNERLHGLLQSVLYTENGRLDLERVRRLLQAAGNANGDTGLSSRPLEDHTHNQVSKQSRVVDETVTEAIRLLFSSRSSLAQKILVNELVSIVDGATVEGLLEAFRLVLGTILSRLLLTDQDFRTPPERDPVYGMVMRMSSEEPQLKVTETDRQTLRNLKATLDAMTSQIISKENIESILSIASKLTPIVPDLMPGFISVLALFVKELTRRKAQKLADSLHA